MNITKYWRILVVLMAAAIMLLGCSSEGKQPGSFDPENPKEYGINGMYVGQSVKEAMEACKPTKADFMDMVTRESYTVDQLAAGEGNGAMGMLLVDNTQLIVKVKDGVLQSIMLGGVAADKAQQFKTNRGLAMFSTKEQLKALYPDAAGDNEITVKGSKSTMSFGVVDNKIVWMRFDSL